MGARRFLMITAIAVVVVAVVGGSITFLLYSLDLIQIPGFGLELEEPDWEVGDSWEYNLRSPELEGVHTTTVVVADRDEVHWYLGADTVRDARYHAVLNHNPSLGRVSVNDYSVYENGEPETLFDFPLKQGKTWSFHLFGLAWRAEVVEIADHTVAGFEKVPVAVIEARGDGGELDYSYSRDAGWIIEMTWHNGGEDLLEMEMVQVGTGFGGDSWFIRADDLHDDTFHSPPQRSNATFSIEDGSYSKYIYYFEINSGGDGTGSIVIRERAGPSLVQQSISPNQELTRLGSLEAVSGDYDYVLYLSGSVDVRIRIAGARDVVQYRT